MAQLQHCIARLTPHKAPGEDGIPNVVLKESLELIAEYLLHIYKATFCQEWVLKLFKVEINRVRCGFECEMRIRLELKRSQRTATIQFGSEFGVALEAYRQVKEISSCSLEVSDCVL